jgi:hypothetical protein
MTAWPRCIHCEAEALSARQRCRLKAITFSCSMVVEFMASSGSPTSLKVLGLAAWLGLDHADRLPMFADVRHPAFCTVHVDH